MNKIMKQRWKMEAIEKCDVMVYTKIFLKFPYKFWPCGHEQRGYYTFWQVRIIYSELLYLHPKSHCVFLFSFISYWVCFVISWIVNHSIELSVCGRHFPSPIYQFYSNPSITSST
ncbi:hypothetical protein CsSME_00038272 [Camellia sinensis var. sinensis]